ncbi:MAG: hypothetical protein GKS06_16855 [Acidobacteria bacterium]|nr:hypothetical protein [Acidobacteriota bacterium]
METKKSNNQGLLRIFPESGLRERLPLRYRGFKSVLLAGLAAFCAADAAEMHGQERVPPVVPALFGAIQVNEPNHDRWATALVDAGLDAVQVTLYARQQEWNGSELHWDRAAPWVVSEIRAAQRAGLNVTLVMRVALEHGLEANRHLWHGMIWPRDDVVDSWFASYAEFVAWGAQIAADESVDLFTIANELSSMTSTRVVTELPDLYAYYADNERTAIVDDRLAACATRVRAAGHESDLVELDGGRFPDLESLLAEATRRRAAWVMEVAPTLARFNVRRQGHEAAWRELIAGVRDIYTGPLAYGANFDQFEEVGFWDDLDAVGVTAYFPLSEYGADRAAQAARMRDRWAAIATRLDALGRPVFLVELGWTRKLGATVRPYSYSRVEVLETVGGSELTCVHWASQPLEPFERVRALVSLAEVVESGAFTALRGLSMWKLSTNPNHRDIEPFVAILGAPMGGVAEDHADREYLAAVARIRSAVLSRR